MLLVWVREIFKLLKKNGSGGLVVQNKGMIKKLTKPYKKGEEFRWNYGEYLH